jgi:preprotein translocase subunit SecF
MSEAKRSIWYRLYHGETAIDFVGRKNRWFALSGLVILLGLVALFTRGLNFGIDFKGGTAWDVPAPGASVARARDTLRSHGLAEAKIQIVGGDRVRVQADLKCGTEVGPKDRKTCDDVTAALAKLGHTTASRVNINTVGPSWGGQITHKAERALVFFFVAITLYISLRFEWKMALAAIVAVVHDILVTVGIYALSGFQVTPGTVIAFLTILGYSLYDTIVVFDKVEENTRGLAASGRMTYADTVNLSMNQVLMRSLNTSLVAIMPVLSVLILGAYVLGATSLEDFGLALTIGLLTGAYSSIFVASPLLAILKEREPRYASIRQRVLAKGGAAPLTPAAAAAAAGSSSGGDGASKPAGAARPAVGARPGGARPAPRPRKKGKRR